MSDTTFYVLLSILIALFFWILSRKGFHRHRHQKHKQIGTSQAYTPHRDVPPNNLPARYDHAFFGFTITIVNHRGQPVMIQWYSARSMLRFSPSQVRDLETWLVCIDQQLRILCATQENYSPEELPDVADTGSSLHFAERLFDRDYPLWLGFEPFSQSLPVHLTLIHFQRIVTYIMSFRKYFEGLDASWFRVTSLHAECFHLQTREQKGTLRSALCGFPAPLHYADGDEGWSWCPFLPPYDVSACCPDCREQFLTLVSETIMPPSKA